MTLDLSDEYLVPDNTESLVYSSKALGSTFTVNNALRNLVTKELIEGRHFKDVIIHGESVNFHVWAAEFPDGFMPIISDQFVDAENITWVVTRLNFDTLRTRWKLECLELRR